MKLSFTIDWQSIRLLILKSVLDLLAVLAELEGPRHIATPYMALRS